MTVETEYRHLVAKLQNRPGLPSLNPERSWHPGVDAEISRLSLAGLSAERPDGAATAPALIAVLYLWNDSLDAAHRLVQDLPSPTGSALHGIMHRREGDYDNAKYWFHRAGDHPAWHGLQARASAWLKDAFSRYGRPSGPIGEAIRTIAAQGIWNPYLFTDAVAMSAGSAGGSEYLDLLEQLQHLELSAFQRFLESRLM